MRVAAKIVQRFLHQKEDAMLVPQYRSVLLGDLNEGFAKSLLVLAKRFQLERLLTLELMLIARTNLVLCCESLAALFLRYAALVVLVSRHAQEYQAVRIEAR